jgi:hypothetical protein
MKIASLLVAGTMLTACRCSHAVKVGGERKASPPVPPEGLSVTAFGAKGDGVTDDRAAIQSALDAATAGTGELYVPPGTYSVGQSGAISLAVHGKLHLRGAGQDQTVLQQAPGVGPAVRLLTVSGDGVVIEDLTVDGNKHAQTKSEQRHGLFVTATEGLVVQRVTARNFTGDGFYLYSNANHSRFLQVVATGNDRNGITFGGMVDGTSISDSKFIGNAAQQVDSEPGVPNIVSNTTITRSLLDTGGATQQHVLTCSGNGSATKGHDWSVVGNTINGGVFIVWAERVVIADNVGVNPTTKPFITVNRSSSDVTIRGNKLKQTQHAVPSLSAVYIGGTIGSGPDGVLVTGNDIEITDERSYGVRVAGAISVEIVDNVLRGAGRAAPGYAGIYVRATVIDRDMRSVIVRGNTIRNFGDRGVSIAGNGAAKLLRLDITNNTFDDDSPVPAMTTGISLDDRTGAVQTYQVEGNKYLGGVTAPVINYPARGVRTAPK